MKEQEFQFDDDWLGASADEDTATSPPVTAAENHVAPVTPALTGNPRAETADGDQAATATTSANPAETPSFEDALESLEKIVAEMEAGHLSLDQCIAQFERGTKLANCCMGKLQETSRKVEVLLKDSDGAEHWQSLDENADAAADQRPL